MDQPFVIDIWSDVVCPFCCIGKAQLARALESFEHRDAVVVRFHAFELDPRAKAVYEHNLDELVAHKYSIAPEKAHVLHERLEREAAQLGLKWNLSIARPGNTFDAHRLIAFAGEHARAQAAVDRLFDAYFSNGEAVSDRTVLARIGDELGLENTAAMLESDAYAAEVRADEADAMELGFSGVPAFLLDRRFVVSGAQPVEVLVDVLNRAWARRSVV